eukprot:15433351-Alexandrium_andersonii.AAC.1
MGQRGLRNHLEPQFLRHPRAEVDQGRLVVHLEQDLAMVPQYADAGRSTVSSCTRPSRRTGGAGVVVREARSLSGRTVTDTSEPSFARKQ